MLESTSPSKPYGSRSRGVSGSDVERAADQLLRAGDRPTVEKVRAVLGTGSPNTINPLLDAWWKRLAARIDAGPAALHRLPETVAHVAEALWMQALEEGRRRVLIELSGDKRAVEHEKQAFEVRSHVLRLREGELDSRLRDRERAYAELEARFRTLTTMLQKEQKTREAQAQRLAELEKKLAPSRTRAPKRANSTLKPRTKRSSAPKSANKRQPRKTTLASKSAKSASRRIKSLRP
jgi:hypothetical protein